MLGRHLLRYALVLGLVFLTGFAFSQNIAIPKVSLDMGSGKGPEDVSSSLQILALLTVLSLAPAIVMLTTAFTRIVIVLGMLRQAIGTPSIPPNQVLIGLSMFLTFFVMGPTYQKVNTTALQPYIAKKISYDKAMQNAEKPIKEFMLKSTYERDLVLFLDMRGEKPKSKEDLSLLTLIPAFILSELKTAFIVGFYLFVPFLIVDLIVASGLMSMGMMMLPPTVVSMPAKVLIFVLADGWHTIVQAVLQGYS